MTRIELMGISVEVTQTLDDIEIIKPKTPVVSGDLREDFQLDENGDIINTMDYADEVELGTTTRPGSHMVERSADEIAKNVARRIADQLRKARVPPINIRIG